MSEEALYCTLISRENVGSAQYCEMEWRLFLMSYTWLSLLCDVPQDLNSVLFEQSHMSFILIFLVYRSLQFGSHAHTHLWRRINILGSIIQPDVREGDIFQFETPRLDEYLSVSYETFRTLSKLLLEVLYQLVDKFRLFEELTFSRSCYRLQVLHLVLYFLSENLRIRSSCFPPYQEIRSRPD